MTVSIRYGGIASVNHVVQSATHFIQQFSNVCGAEITFHLFRNVPNFLLRFLQGL